MGEKRERRNGQYLIKDEEGEEVAAEGDAQRSVQGKGKAEEEPSLGPGLKAPHISDGIGRGCDPEAGGKGCKEKSKGIDPELERDSRKEFNQSPLDHLPFEHIRDHRDDNGEFNQRGDEGPPLSQVSY